MKVERQEDAFSSTAQHIPAYYYYFFSLVDERILINNVFCLFAIRNIFKMDAMLHH